MALRGYKWVVKWYFLVGLGIRTGLRLGLDMSKMVFFSSTNIKMGLRLGLNMGLGGDIGGIVCKERRYFGNVFFILTPNRASY